MAAARDLEDRSGLRPHEEDAERQAGGDRGDSDARRGVLLDGHPGVSQPHRGGDERQRGGPGQSVQQAADIRGHEAVEERAAVARGVDRAGDRDEPPAPAPTGGQHEDAENRQAGEQQVPDWCAGPMGLSRSSGALLPRRPPGRRRSARGICVVGPDQPRPAAAVLGSVGDPGTEHGRSVVARRTAGPPEAGCAPAGARVEPRPRIAQNCPRARSDSHRYARKRLPVRSPWGKLGRCL